MIGVRWWSTEGQEYVETFVTTATMPRDRYGNAHALPAFYHLVDDELAGTTRYAEQRRKYGLKAELIED